MRCLKCGYISFDYNKLCPKCNRDISDEQMKLNLPDYKPSPPSLLGKLIGSEDESKSGLTVDRASAPHDSAEVTLTDASMLGADSKSIDFDDDHDLEISLSDDSEEFELPEIDLNSESADTGEIVFNGEEDLSTGLNGDEIISPVPDKDNELDLELDGMLLDEDEKESTIELNVSDLKINETGELEISSFSDENLTPGDLRVKEETEKEQNDIDSGTDLELKNNKTGSLELSDLTLNDSEELGSAETIETLFSKDSKKEEEGISIGDDETFDLSSLSFEDNENTNSLDTSNLRGFDKDDKENLDLGDLAFGEDKDFLTNDQDMDNGETGELRLSDTAANRFKKSASESENKAVNGETSSIKINDILDDDLTLDLENLDLDLDLDDFEDKK